MGSPLRQLEHSAACSLSEATTEGKKTKDNPDSSSGPSQRATAIKLAGSPAPGPKLPSNKMKKVAMPTVAPKAPTVRPDVEVTSSEILKFDSEGSGKKKPENMGDYYVNPASIKHLSAIHTGPSAGLRRESRSPSIRSKSGGKIERSIGLGGSAKFSKVASSPFRKEQSLSLSSIAPVTRVDISDSPPRVVSMVKMPKRHTPRISAVGSVSPSADNDYELMAWETDAAKSPVDKVPATPAAKTPEKWGSFYERHRRAIIAVTVVALTLIVAFLIGAAVYLGTRSGDTAVGNATTIVRKIRGVAYKDIARLFHAGRAQDANANAIASIQEWLKTEEDSG